MEQNLTVACFMFLVVFSSFIEGQTISNEDFHQQKSISSLENAPQIIKRSVNGDVPSESIERLIVSNKLEGENGGQRRARSPLSRMPSYFGKRARMDRKLTRMDRMPAVFGKRSRMDRMPAMFGKRSANQQRWYNDQEQQPQVTRMLFYPGKRSTMERMPAMFGKRSTMDRMPSLFGKRSTMQRMPSLFGKRSTMQRMPSLFGKRSTLNRMPSLFGKRKVYIDDTENSDDISDSNLATYDIPDFELPAISESGQTTDDEIENDLNSNIFTEDS